MSACCEPTKADLCHLDQEASLIYQTQTMIFTTTLPNPIHFDGSTLKRIQGIGPSRHILADITSSPGNIQPRSYHSLKSPILGSVVMSYQRPRDFPGRNRPDPQRFLTPLGWAVRFPDGRIVYENRMGRQGPQPRPPRGGFPSPRQFPGQYPRQPQGQYPGQSMGGFSGQSQGQYPGQSMGGFPGQSQGQFTGQYFGQLPSQSSTQSPNSFPGMVITQSSGQIPGVTIIQPPGQSPGVFISPYPGQVLGQTPAGQEMARQPSGPKPRQRFRIGPERVRLADLKEDETDCPICYRDYYSSDSQNESEDAVRIGCGHVYGRRCLDKWIQETDTCPTCRGKLDLVDDVAGNP